MFEVVLYQPEIAPNTGNVIRLCANTGARLHLIEPLGFAPDDTKLRRAGLDYGDWQAVQRHSSLDDFARAHASARIFAFSTRGTTRHTDARFVPGDVLLFGPETRGLPADVLAALPEVQRLRLPLMPGNRSLNLSNAVAVAVYEAWRQQGFAGGL